MGAVDGVALIDQHCHGVWVGDLEPETFAACLTEAKSGGREPFASLLGLAVRRWCAPVLDLPAHATPDEYLARRAELGWRAVARRLLGAAGVAEWFVDTGYAPGPTTTPAELAALGGGTGREVVRVETVAEAAIARAESPAALLEEIDADLRTTGAVAYKTVLGYRSGLGLPPAPPATADALAAAESVLRAGAGRLTDPVLGAWLVYRAARLGAELARPLQFHTGFGDPDLTLSEVDPSRLTGFLRATAGTGLSVVLLHCWPYHRNAAYLAHAYPHVFVDIGPTVPFVGARAGAVLGELLELAPFDAVLYSSDGNVLPELHHLGAVLWRHHLGRLLDGWLADDILTAADADRLVAAMAAGNADRIHPRA